VTGKATEKTVTDAYSNEYFNSTLTYLLVDNG
jgi:hypothetical protein